MAFLVQQDGTSKFLLQNGTDHLILNTGVGAPTITSIVPATGPVSPTSNLVVQGIVLTGTGFSAPYSGGNASVGASGGGVMIMNAVINSDTTITFDMQVLAGAATGTRTVTVTTDNGSANTTFTIAAIGGTGGAKSIFNSPVFG